MKAENGSRCDLCTELLKDTAPGTISIISISVVTHLLDENGREVPGAIPQHGAAAIRFCTRCSALIGAGAIKPNDAVAYFIANARQQLNKQPS